MIALSFPTQFPPTVAVLPVPKLVSATLAKVISGAWTEGHFLRCVLPVLAPGESNLLGGMMRTSYAAMRKNAGFAKCGSAVPYCFAVRPHAQGHVFVHSPPKVADKTPVLVLLNGYGGNLLYLPWAIRHAAPEAVLVAPSWEINWSNGPLEQRKEYLIEALAAASEHLDWKLSRPWLCGLSQGGIAAFELAENFPELFQG